MSSAILLFLLAIASLIDLRSQVIPDILTFPGMLLGAISTILTGKLSVWEVLLGIFIPGLLMLAIVVVTKGGMGGGDVKLLAMIGSFIGWRGAISALFWGSLVGSCVSLLLILMKKKGRRDPIPFGPFLAIGVLFFLWRGNII
jgi:leader peptidase (prepilin peptidase)/N-methyltransferase